ncbi:MAG TPA: CehA/McbA family metallohydrolase [Thermoplasmata archaeon]|nr:CehA/McbA family metallohydrolase [Thermoplasmata archaeon]
MTEGLRLDLHVHSRYSPDSRLSLEQLAVRLPYTGLRGFALTDHNSVRGNAELAELQEAHPTYVFLPGVEVSTLEGHLLAYGVAEAPPTRRPVAETIEWVLAHGGEPVLAHPFRWVHGVGRGLAETAPVRAIEARNGHNSEVADAKAELVGARRGLGMTGGSDVHALPELGRAFTLFPEESRSADDLLEALRRGRTLAGGRSLPFPGRMRVGLATGAKFLTRGFRPI